MSPLEKAIRRERLRLIALDEKTIRHLERSYEQVLTRMKQDLGRLTEAIQEAREAGVTVNPQWLYRQDRYRALTEQAEQRLGRFYQSANGAISEAKKNAIKLGVSSAETLTVASMGANLNGTEALVRGSFNQMNTAALDAMIHRARDGKPLGDLLTEATRPTLDKVQDTLAYGVAAGKSPRWIAAEMARVSEMPLTRAKLISRTEVVGSYRDAASEAFKESPVVTGWTWKSAQSPTTCPVCWAMDGEEFDDDETLDSHPSCFPAGTVVSGPAPVGATTRRYEGDLIEIRLDGGGLLAVTPNHPILTPRGWVAAGDLREGHDVIRSRRGERDSAGHPDDHERPVLIEEVAETLRGTGKVTAGTVPASPENFHGDGAGGNVDVVLADRFLKGDRDASIFEHGREVALAFRRVALALFAGLGSTGEFLGGSLATAGGSMGGGNVAPVFFGRSCRHHLAVGFGAPADLDSGVEQPWPDCGSGDAQRFGNRVLGLAGPVAGDDLGVGQVGSPGGAHLGGPGTMPLGQLSAKRGGDAFAGTADLDPALDQEPPEGPRGDVELFAKRHEAFPVEVSLDGTVEPGAIGRGAPAAGAQLDTTVEQFPFESSEIDVEDLAEFAEGLPGDVAVDRIVDVTRRSFRGHVHNLQTVDGWYTANSIIVHNCRCTQVPRTASWSDLGIPGMEDTRPPLGPTGPEAFDQLTEAEQRAILGPSKFEAWKNGEFDLPDLVKKTPDTGWGPGRRMRSLKEIRAGKKGAPSVGGSGGGKQPPFAKSMGSPDGFPEGHDAEPIWAEAARPISADVLEGVNNYVDKWYREVNSYLAYDEIPDAAEDLAVALGVIKRLDLALEIQATTKQGTVLFRSERPGRMTERWLSANIGQVIYPKRYFSTTTRPEMIKGSEYEDKGGIWFTVIVPPGARGLDMRRLSTHPKSGEEFEILLSRVSGFRVLSRRKVDGETHMRIELVP